MVKNIRAKSRKIMLDDEVMGQVEEFRSEFREGAFPTEYLMPFLLLLGIYSYRRGMRMEPEIKLGED